MCVFPYGVYIKLENYMQRGLKISTIAWEWIDKAMKQRNNPYYKYNECFVLSLKISEKYNERRCFG